VLTQPLRIFIGYDERETIAYHVLAHSIIARASVPVTIAPLARHQLGGWYDRQRGPLESTAFSMTRFLVPALCGFQGRAIFMDCDMLCRVDIIGLWAEFIRQPDKAVLVCQHDYTPKESTKFLGQQQTAYPRKNWSSLMLFDCSRCKALTPEYVGNASGLDLHRFNWTTDAEIGALPLEWNHLVGEYGPNERAKILHWTLGGPWFDATQNTDCADEWHREAEAMRGLVAA
jgi:hypothetical protein